MKRLLILLLTVINFAHAQGQNKKLTTQLAAIYKADQYNRKQAIAIAKKYGSGSAEDKKLMDEQAAADVINLQKIEKIIAQYGYPGKSLVGSQSSVAFFVVQHADLAAQEKYLPLFEAAAKKGELDRHLLPLMIDRIRTAKGQPQLYGTQLRERKNGSVQIYPIEDEANVDVRRKAAGLPPLNTYLKKWQINYQLPSGNQNPNPPDLYIAQTQTTPESEGSDKAIFSKLNYPEQARAANISGYVTVEFTIGTDGHATDISVVKGLGYGCDEEAIRVIKAVNFTNKTGETIERRMRLPFPYKE